MPVAWRPWSATKVRPLRMHDEPVNKHERSSYRTRMQPLTDKLDLELERSALDLDDDLLHGQPMVPARPTTSMSLPSTPASSSSEGSLGSELGGTLTSSASTSALSRWGDVGGPAPALPARPRRRSSSQVVFGDVGGIFQMAFDDPTDSAATTGSVGSACSSGSEGFVFARRTSTGSSRGRRPPIEPSARPSGATARFGWWKSPGTGGSQDAGDRGDDDAEQEYMSEPQHAKGRADTAHSRLRGFFSEGALIKDLDESGLWAEPIRAADGATRSSKVARLLGRGTTRSNGIIGGAGASCSQGCGSPQEAGDGWRPRSWRTAGRATATLFGGKETGLVKDARSYSIYVTSVDQKVKPLYGGCGESSRTSVAALPLMSAAAVPCA